MNPAGKNIFFLGKGGTGKTTLAVITAIGLHSAGKKVVVISLDPAHNLFDLIDVKAKNNLYKMDKNFVFEEINVRYWIKKYLKTIENKISGSYQYLTSLSLEKHLSILKFSPGLEEFALMYAFEEMKKKYAEFPFIIFDLPPTGLALRFLNLPNLSLIWLEKLIELRKKILDKKKIIHSIHQDKSKNEPDKVLRQLLYLQEHYMALDNNLRDKKSSIIHLVLNEDELSIAETGSIISQTGEIGISISRLVVNKYQKMCPSENFSRIFKNIPIEYFPQSDQSLIGLSILQKYSKRIKNNYTSELIVEF